MANKICKVIIEETISQEFTIEYDENEDIYDKVCDMYKDGKLVVEPSIPTCRQMMSIDKDGNETEWKEF